MRKLDSFAQDHAGADHILSLLRRLRLDWLLHHFPPRLVRSLYVFVNGFITIGVLALLALLSRNPFVFPSLGPTAYLLFFSPLAKTSSPRNTISATLSGSSVVMPRSLSQAPERYRLGYIRYLLANNPGGGSFALGHRRVHGSPRC